MVTLFRLKLKLNRFPILVMSLADLKKGLLHRTLRVVIGF